MAKLLILQVIAVVTPFLLFAHAQFEQSSYKDFADIVAELRQNPPIVVKVKEEREVVHMKLMNLATLLEERIQDHNAGLDDPEEDKKVRDQLQAVALAVKLLDDDNERIIEYGRNLTSWFNATAAEYSDNSL